MEVTSGESQEGVLPRQVKKMDGDSLKEFQKVYIEKGKYDLTAQIPYLASLAESYKQRYLRSGNWMDCLKAHSLYNSVYTRSPDEEHWREKAFELQQLYWGEKSSTKYDTHKQLIDDLKSKLKIIRDTFRESMKDADDLIGEIHGDNVSNEVCQRYYDVMKRISLECSEEMRAFGERIIRESMNIISTPPPVTFEAVAIGSIARGEATPYSDLEYLFLVDKQTENSVQYFELLSMVSYFIMGNLGETKLSYMNVKELYGWFGDKSKNGFKIDGLAPGAGNIPTGNSPHNRNHFIITPEQLADRYKATLDNPDPKEALRGDLTSMLTYTKSLYMYSNQNAQQHLLLRYYELVKAHSRNQTRSEMDMDMLKTDAKKFNFVPDDRLQGKGFSADVKKEIYRFPSILLLDICIVCECAESTSWESLETLAHRGTISQDLFESMKFLLAAATYIRLSTYLHHDSHDDRMSLSQKLTAGIANASKLKKSTQRWFLPSELYLAYCTTMMPLKQSIQQENVNRQHLAQFSVKSDPWWTHVTALYYSGNFRQALSVLKEKYYSDSYDNPVVSALQLHKSLPHSVYDTLHIISETLFWCDENRAALQLYEYMTDNNISDTRMRIADCQHRLGDYNKAIEILNHIPDKSSDEYCSLGNAYKRTGQYEKAEQCFLQALQIEYNNTSAEPLTDYYGNTLTTDCDIQDKVDLMGAASPEDRLTMITHITPDIITCLGSLGDVYRLRKKYSTAEAYFMTGLQLLRDLYGDGAAVLNAAHTLCNLAVNYNNMEQYSKAEDYYLQALTVFRQISHGDDSVYIAKTLYNIAVNYTDTEQYNKAEEYYLQALTVYRQISHGVDSFYIAETLHSIASNYNNMKRYNKAEDYHLQALTMFKQISHGAGSVEIANTLCNLALLHLNRGYKQAAIEKFTKAHDIYMKINPTNPRVPKIEAYLAATAKCKEMGEDSK